MPSLKEPAKNRRVFIHMDRLGVLSEKAIKTAFDDIGRNYQKTMAREMRKRNKRGRIYNVRSRSGGTRRHRASAPDQTPANLSGNMAQGIDYKVSGSKKMEFGARAFYAKFLEEGTKKMEPRPGLLNTINKTEKETFNYFADHLQKWLFKAHNP